jgi:hypothetical protein
MNRASRPDSSSQVVKNSTGVAQSNSGNATVNIYQGPPPIDYTIEMRQDVAVVLAFLRTRRAMFSDLDQEIWRYAFESLRRLRDELAKTAGRLRVRAPKSVFDQVSFMADAITAYLAEYEANYERFMASHGGWEPGWARTEREWLASTGGKVARDMVRMRGAINTAIENLNVYADTGEAAELFEPSMARFWAEQFGSTDQHAEREDQDRGR